ncbi:MAG: cell division protein FtsH, partial [candidate division Zixibacteria bacterium CG_4_9_14_3_um_filter_46_8]
MPDDNQINNVDEQRSGKKPPRLNLKRKDGSGKSGPEPRPEMPWKKTSRTLAFWVVIILLSVLFVQFYYGNQEEIVQIDYTEFMQQVESGNINKVTFIEKDLRGDFKQPFSKLVNGRKASYSKFKTYLPFDDPALVTKLRESGITVSAEPVSINWASILLSTLPWLLLIVFWLFMMRQMQGGGTKGIFSFGKSRARLLTGDRPKITFEDVAGADEAKQELQEIIDFLRDPGKYQKLGGKIPKGALLLGSPG